VIVLTLVITGLFLFQFPKAHIDTDPENMLETYQADRVFYDQIKKDFGIRDMIVLGITDESGIFRLSTLGKIARITDEILKIDGVIVEDVISFTTTDNVTSEGGLMKVRRIMEAVPRAEEEVEAIRTGVYDNPLFIEKIVSKDADAVALYIPIQQKDMSYRISKEIELIVQKELGEAQNYYIAGLPVAEDTFGFEMFIQMGILAPLIGLVIFLLMWVLFHKISLIVSPMIVAMFSVAWGMGALIGFGFTVHIMSSMIPIFLMPIAVLDSVHILSEFYDRYPALQDRKQTLLTVTEELFTPMLYTSITTAVGFASLTLADIPPVRIFGAFVAFGIMAAWFLTVTFIPASIMLIREEKLRAKVVGREKKSTFLTKLLPKMGQFAFRQSRMVVLGAVLILALGIWGLTKIVVNDNPVNWFNKDHKIRVADRVMNQRFGGTYMAYLAVEGQQPEDIKRPEVMAYINELQKYLEENDVVGKTSSVADIVKRVGQVLKPDEGAGSITPESQEEIGQYLFLFLMSGDPNDLDNFVDYDYRKANIWVQMKRGDNQDMEQVEAAVEQFFENNRAPEGIGIRWSGLTYINKVWQDLMVKGMLKAVLGGFAAVFILMLILFRSPGLAFISMMPLTFAIILSYGLIGFIGKDYDMPIAVCSSLALGLSIDFAIHFIQRFRQKYQEGEDLEVTNRYIFQEPARAISRNAFVIILGFLPLVLATLGPYVTVGSFFAMLMTFSALTTLLLLPALMRMVGFRFIKQ
ncbi:MAG: MMPL family transporter, partial [Phycisphaerae bacterium]|nr:MMPL family transporter [candidate division Zixibacteria bacterium]NIU58654.1 MMPL family transporter [Phycisphaerae bacterium]NIW92793.1 MMPL family transporter [Phycisphaerae bacterium]NIX54637.1 MMPL family transporter [candidate division Zixibacteria bacterium]